MFITRMLLVIRLGKAVVVTISVEVIGNCTQSNVGHGHPIGQFD